MSNALQHPEQKPSANIVTIERISYEDAFDLQRKLVCCRSRDAIEDTLLLLEHWPVFTANREASFRNILATEEWLQKEGIAIRKTDRGGDVTYHGPGQIVGYNIADIKRQEKDLHVYVRNMEQIVINTLTEYGIKAGRDAKHPGVWIGNEKICAVGIAVNSNWISMHGFALNVQPNMAHYGMIVACGIADKGVTSMKAVLGKAIDMQEVREIIVKHYATVYKCEPRHVPLEELVK